MAFFGCFQSRRGIDNPVYGLLVVTDEIRQRTTFFCLFYALCVVYRPRLEVPRHVGNDFPRNVVILSIQFRLQHGHHILFGQQYGYYIAEALRMPPVKDKVLRVSSGQRVTDIGHGMVA